MKRRLTKLVLFLLLGAIVNVLVAWSIGISDGNPQKMMKDWDVTGLSIIEGERWWSVRQRQNPGTFVLESYRKNWLALMGSTIIFRGRAFEEGEVVKEGVDPTRLIPYWLSDFSVPTKELGTARYTSEYRTAIAHGWPCLVTWSQGVLRYSSMPPRAPVILGRGSWEIPFIQPRNGVQPSVAFYPIWHGVIVNTIFYGAILWLLTLGPFAARRFIRNKRGHCIKCGYDLRGAEHEVCPECGAACGPSIAASC